MGYGKKWLLAMTEEDYTRINRVRTTLTDVSGKKVTLAATVRRAFDALEDNHSRGAWLTGPEAAAVIQDRHERQVIGIMGQLLEAFKIDLHHYLFDRERGVLELYTAQMDRPLLFVAPPLEGNIGAAVDHEA